SWLATQMQIGYRYYLGADWRERMCSAEVWHRLAEVDDEALWETHQVLKRQMLNYVARRRVDHGAPDAAALEGEVLTLTFARSLLQGSDVWLNTPRRPFEACGTSGQKALFNGALNLSVPDGWWAEAYDGSNGFAIGEGQTHSDPATQDARDAEALYRVLEDEV